MEACVGRASSGGSVGTAARVRERGFGGGEGGAVPKPAKEKLEDDEGGGFLDPFVDGGGGGVALEIFLLCPFGCVVKSLAVEALSLTISVPPSSLT